MGASRAVLLPRIKPRRRFFGGGSENEDPTGCATPHPDKKTRSRADDPLTRTQSDSCGNAEPSEPVDPGGGDACGPERPGRHDRTASASSVSASPDGDGEGAFLARDTLPGSSGGRQHAGRKNASRRDERLRVETRAAGTRAVRAAVAADHEGRIHAAARDYAVSLKHFDVYLRVEPDAALAEAVRSKAEQYRARLARIREVLTHAHEPAKAGDDDAISARNASARNAEMSSSASASSSSTRPAPEPSHTETDLLKASPRALPRQPLRAIQHAAPGRFVVTLARPSVAGEENGGDAFGGLRLHPESTREAKREARGVLSSADRSPIERARVTDEEADAWVEDARETRGEGKGAKTKALMTVNEKEKETVSFHEKNVKVEDAFRHSRNQTEERDEKTTENGVATPSVRSAVPEEHPNPPSTPPARPAVSLRARSLRRAYWDTEFPGLLAFTEEDHRDDDARDDEEKDETKENVRDSDSFFFESAVDDAVRAFNVWFDASLRVLGDSIAETGSSYAPKVERLFKRGVSAIDKEWRAQFPDDATYISELSKKEYPSEANAVMRAATPFVHARAEKGARAD